MTAEKCPICEGTGRIMEGPDKPVSVPRDDTDEPLCHGCDGKGWIVFDPTVYITQPVIQYDVHAT